jgi:hypothetical protein
MTYLNQFHKEAMERTMKKIVEFKKSPMNSKDFANYMRRNLEMAIKMENDSDICKTYEYRSV